jgi:hypothetical protein
MALALGSASITATFAQTTNEPSTAAPGPVTSGGWHHHDSVLTADEKAQLKKAHQEALAADGTLQSEQASLKQQFAALKSQGDSTTHEQWQALHQQARDFHQKLKSAELLIDPSLAPIFAKLEAAHQNDHSHHSA